MNISNEGRVCVGAIAGVHGLKGEVKIKSFTADPHCVAAYGPVCTENEKYVFHLTIKSIAKGMLIARLDGIEDRTSAEKLKGERLYVPRSALPEPESGEFYQSDLVGLSAETNFGEKIGAIKAIYNFGASDIIEIALKTGEQEEEMMIPFTNEIVPEVDIKGGRVVINLPDYVGAENPKEKENT